MTGDLDTAAGIAATDGVAGTTADSRITGAQDRHRIEVRNHRLWLIIVLFHNSQIYPIKQIPLYIVQIFPHKCKNTHPKMRFKKITRT